MGTAVQRQYRIRAGLIFDALITGRTNTPELAERAAAAILRAPTVTS